MIQTSTAESSKAVFAMDDDAEDKLRILKSTAKYQQQSPGKQQSWVRVEDNDDNQSESSAGFKNRARKMVKKPGSVVNQSSPIKAFDTDIGNNTSPGAGGFFQQNPIKPAI